MYSVVGCRECHGLWIVEGRPETTRCRRCGTRRQFEALRVFAETDTSDAAARVRSAMLAERADEGEFVDPADVDLEAVGVDTVEFLSASGVDPGAVSAAGARAERGTEGSRSRKEVLLEGLAELEEPTEPALKEYAASFGVSEEYVEAALEKLQRSGEILRTNGSYRKL
jgi:DNA replicative helicase MCM subunit Mcm2 (Cdc46/Mcm family)